MDPLMMAIAGNAVGSFLLGKEKREARLEDQKLKQQQLKMLMDAQKMREAKEQRELEKHQLELSEKQWGRGYLERKMAGSSQGGQPSSGLQFGETFPKDKPQSNIDPLEMMALEALGLPGFKLGNAMMDQNKAMMDQARFNRDATQGSLVDVRDGHGGTYQVWQPKYGGPAVGGGIAGYQPPKPELRQFEEGGKTYEVPVQPFTQQPLGPPTIKSEKKGMPGESAGKMGMLQSGLEAITQVQKMLMPGGEPNADTYKVLAQMEANLPWTTGRQAGALIDDALEGKLRIESGAAVPDSEVKRMAKRFKPSVTDQPALIKQKLTRMETYLRGTIELLDPNKNYGKNVETFTAEDGKKYVVKPNAKLDQAKAVEYLRRANGDKAKARELAKAEGWEF